MNYIVDGLSPVGQAVLGNLGNAIPKLSTGTSCSLLGTQIHGVELGLVDWCKYNMTQWILRLGVQVLIKNFKRGENLL